MLRNEEKKFEFESMLKQSR